MTACDYIKLLKLHDCKGKLGGLIGTVSDVSTELNTVQFCWLRETCETSTTDKRTIHPVDIHETLFDIWEYLDSWTEHLVVSK
jgi:hypothetical protein